MASAISKSALSDDGHRAHGQKLYFSPNWMLRGVATKKTPVEPVLRRLLGERLAQLLGRDRSLGRLRAALA